MHTHADKIQENKNQLAVDPSHQKQNSGEPTFQFVDNRPEAIAQRKLQEVVNNSQKVKQLRAFQEMTSNSYANNKQPIQLKPMNKVKVQGELLGDEKGYETLKILDQSKVIECDELRYKNKEVPIYGLTLPHEDPPTIYINQTVHPNDQVVALTLFHESRHVIDKDTPGASDDSSKALKQDNINEAKVWREEAIYALERGGEYLKNALSQKAVKLNNKSGKYELNEEVFSELASGAYDTTEKRSERFKKANYTPIKPRDLSGGWLDES